jgi:hypothetical protein
MQLNLVVDPDEPDDLYLAHAELDDLNLPEQVRRVGRDIVNDIRAAASFSNDRHASIEFRDVVRPVNEDGTLGPRSIYADLEERVSVVVAYAVGSTATRHPALRALELMQSDESFREASRLFAECGDDYGKLYVVFEHACDAAMAKRPKKPSINGLVSQRWAAEADINRFMKVANAKHRHRERQTDQTMEPREARSFVGAILAAWVNWKVPH